MKKLVAVLLVMVMILGMSGATFAGTIDAPKQVLVGQDITVTLLGDNAMAHNAKVVWIINGVNQGEVDAGKITDINGNDLWTSTFTVKAENVGFITFDAVINKYKRDGSLQITEDSAAVTVEVINPINEPSIKLGKYGFITQGSGKQKVTMKQLVFENIKITRMDGTVGELVDYKVGGFKDGNYEGRNFSIEFENLIFDFVYENGNVVLLGYTIQ